MNEAVFIRNPYTITELRVREKNGELHKYIIEKVVEINDQDYIEFSNHLLLEYDFIFKYADLMNLDSNNALHCILVTVSGAVDGILIKNDGSDRYAAYWSYLNNHKIDKTREEKT